MPVARLDDRAVVSVSGADARSFLHNLLTLDMTDVERDRIGYGALLSPQGKILADFLLHAGAEGWLLDLRREAVEDLLKRLALYRLRSKVDIRPEPGLAVFAAWETEAADAPADPRLADLGRRWVAPRDEAADADGGQWHAWRIAHAMPEGGLDFVFGDAFPHDAAMDDLNGVDFAKGCFVGQEVVSRMQHRGTARRRIVAVHAVDEAGPLPDPGAEILAGERPAGRMGSSAGGRGIALIRLDRVRDALDEGLPLRAGAHEVHLALPAWARYGWPAEAGPDGN